MAKEVINGKFAPMDDFDKRLLGIEIDAKPAKQFLDARALAKVAKEQKDGLANLTRLAQGRDQKISALDRDLPRDVKAQRAREITASYEPQITKLKGEIDSRAAVAESNRSSFDLRGTASRGRFGNDTEHSAMSVMWGNKLQRLITPHFVEAVARTSGEGAQAVAFASLILDELDARESEAPASPKHVTRQEREKILTALEGVPTINAEMRAGRKLIDEITLDAREAKIANGEASSRDLIAAGILRGDLEA